MTSVLPDVGSNGRVRLLQSSPIPRSRTVGLLGVVLSGSLLLAGCSSTEDGTAAVIVTSTVQLSPPPLDTETAVTVPEPTASPETTSRPSTSAEDPESTAAPEPETSENTENTEEPDETSETSETDETSEPAETTRTTQTSESGDDTIVPDTDFDPLSLPDVPAADPDAAGPEGGTKCASDPSYFDEKPTGLEENLVKAWRAVEKAANKDGVVVCLNDGKRSRAQQQATFDEYVTQYGEEVAKQYVLPPDKSSHVTGNAIDVQPAAAFNWLRKTDGAFGLCRIYENELWHFEFQKSYAADGCPALLPKPEG